MERLRITYESLFKWTVFLFAIPTVLLFLAAYLIVMLGLGGGWAYAGSAGCHFVLNPLGMLMLAVLVIGGLTLLAFAVAAFSAKRRTKTPVNN